MTLDHTHSHPGVDDMKKTLLLSSAMLIAAISTASAADLTRPMYTKAPPVAPPEVFSWTGFYIGLNVGGKWAHTDDTIDVPGASFGLGSTTDSTVIGGGQIGYNWQAPGSPWVFGIEADADGQHWKTTRTIGGPLGPFIAGDTFTVESNWEASIRGRIGYAWDRTLLYATGGAAFTEVKGGNTLVGIGSVTDDQTLVGGTVGGGIEYAFTNNISLGVEGRWTFYGSNDFHGVSPVTQHIKLDTAEVLGKINFRFW
jgi:outer membrane immunogenic protein